jgi:hypothetical protein
MPVPARSSDKAVSDDFSVPAEYSFHLPYYIRKTGKRKAALLQQDKYIFSFKYPPL